MFDSLDGGHSELSLERLEQLVANINTKFTALQRNMQQKSSTLHDLGGEFAPCDSKVPNFYNREENAFSGVVNDSPMPATSNKPRWSNYWAERELYFATSDLCHYLNGGVNYRMMCLQYQRMFELVVTLLREDVAIARAIGLIPDRTPEKTISVSTVPEEEKTRLSENGQAGQAGVKEDAAPPPPPPLQQETLPPTDALEGCKKRGNVKECESQGFSPQVDRRHSHPLELGGGLDNEKRSNRHVSMSDEIVKNDAVGHAQTGEKYAPLFLNHPSAGDANEDTYDVITPILYQSKENTEFIPARTPSKDSDTNESSPGGAEGNADACYQFLDSFHDDLKHYDGVDVLTTLTKLVFLKEFEEGGATTAVGAFSEFKKQLEERYLPIIENYEALKTEFAKHTSLSCEYVVNCMQSHVKPTRRLLELLAGIDSEHVVTSISLTNMKLGDAVMQTFLPLLSRMDSVRILDLSYNALHDDTVCQLCDILQRHPVLEVIDLSGNFITDTSGAALVRLSMTMKHLKAVGQYGIKFSPPVLNALTAQLKQNRDSGNTSWAPALIFKGACCVNQSGERVFSAIPRPPPPPLPPPPPPPTTTTTTTMTTRNAMSEPSPMHYQTPCGKNESVISRNLGTLQRVRLPYLTALRGSADPATYKIQNTSY